MSSVGATFASRIVAGALTGPLCLVFATLSFSAEPTVMIGCLIRATPENGVLRLEAVANAPRIATGTYRFEIFKQSSTGTSQNLQSGAFHIDAGHDEILTAVVLDGSALGQYRARLTLESPEFGSVSCVSP